jgi:DNA-binding NarL/FixJ family response regulator
VHAGLRAGASGFLLKDVPAPDLMAAIRTIAAGDSVLSPSTTRRLIERFVPLLPPESTATTTDSLAALTNREKEVFELIARGRSNREIADALFLSEGTVKIHVSRVLAKLGLRDRVHAVILAYEAGLRIPGDS